MYLDIWKHHDLGWAVDHDKETFIESAPFCFFFLLRSLSNQNNKGDRNHKFAYSAMKHSNFHFLHFTVVLVISQTWNELYLRRQKYRGWRRNNLLSVIHYSFHFTAWFIIQILLDNNFSLAVGRIDIHYSLFGMLERLVFLFQFLVEARLRIIPLPPMKHSETLTTNSHFLSFNL